MMEAPVGSPVIHFFRISIALSLLLSASAHSGDCQTAGSTCALEDAVPIRGEALLQHLAKLEQTAPQTANPMHHHHEETLPEKANPMRHHQQKPAKSMIQKQFGGHSGGLHRTHVNHTTDHLPAEAKKLFNQKLCKAHQTSLTAKSTPPKSSGKTTHGGGAASDKSNHQDKESRFSRSFFDNIPNVEDAENEKLESMKASLDQAGFTKVRKLTNDKEMALFIRRVAESCNMKVIDEGGLNGAVGWFSNPDVDGPSFENLKADLFTALLAASRDHWVSINNVSGITAETATLDLVGYVQVRALRKKTQTIEFVRRMVVEMGIRITDQSGFKGLMVYYSEPDDSESFQKLMGEIKKAAYERKWAEVE